ncbi:MAG TPA: ATP-binding cassette domain-containing protein [Halothiobacillus sp.]|nr:MAG: ABC transporter ATP-binding protein [Halothiobacillus sp. 20-54-6]HQT43023.1 ATP-binding cassette domain-containing protein [Halothiobacillus sp.]
MIQLKSVSLRRGTQLLLENANLTLQPGYRLGLVGRNGTGKSSLLALIEGTLMPDMGEVERAGGQRLATVAQEIDELDVSAVESVLSGDVEYARISKAIAIAELAEDGMALATLYHDLDAIDGFSARARAARLLDGLGFAPDAIDRPVRSFSGGWRMRINLARALLAPSDIMLLDEPTNHLDLDAVFWLEQWLISYPGSLVVVSHDRDFLDQVCTHIAHIENKSLTVYTSNYSGFESMRAERQAQNQAFSAKIERERAHLNAFVDRFRAQASKAKQAQSRIKALARLPVLAATHADSAFNFSFRPAPNAPDPLLTMEHIDLGYNGNVLLKNIELTVRAGDRIGLLGSNGAGKTTLMRVLGGAEKPMAGKLFVSAGVRIGYYAQHQLEQLDPRDTPMSALERIAGRASTQEVRSFLGGFGFIGDRAFEVIEPFSGGEKARLALALLVWQAPNLLLLDEPTNHLDLEMRESLAAALQTFEGALVVVSHDRSLIEMVCDGFWRVHAGQVGVFDGDLEDYRRALTDERRAANQPAKSAEKVAAQPVPAKAESKPKAAPSKRSTDRIKAIESRLSAVVKSLQALDIQLADPALYQNPDSTQAHTLTGQRQILEEEHAALESEWLALND